MGKGYVIVHGGGTTGRDTTGTLVRRASEQARDPLFVVLGQVSETPLEKGRSSADWLKENGAKNVYVATVTETDISGLPELLQKLEAAHGFWIPGGDQNRLMKLLGKTPVPSLLRRIIENGGAGGGSSAGASLCGEGMPTGDGDRAVMKKGSVITAPGLNLLPGFLVDTHFFARERTQRSVNMILSRPELVGLGVEENGWFEVDLKRGTLFVGAMQVMSLHAAGPITHHADGTLACPDIRLRILKAGDSVSLKELRRK